MRIAVLLPLVAFASTTLVPRQNNNTNNDDDDDLDFDLDNEGEFLRFSPRRAATAARPSTPRSARAMTCVIPTTMGRPL
jgi:hypothetical protein